MTPEEAINTEIDDDPAAAAAMAETDVEVDEHEGEPAPPNDVEQLASEMGWVPEDQYRGDPEKWVNARTFIKKGPEIYKATLSKLDTELVEVKDTVKRLARTSETASRRAYERAKADLETQRRQAVEDGDTEAYDQTTKAIESLDESDDDPKPNGADAAPTADSDPNYRPFIEANSWYEDDIEMGAYADQIAARVARNYGQGKAFYDGLAAEVRKRFPDKFQNPERRQKARVEGPGSGPGSRRGTKKTYRDLPAEGKEACKRFVAAGLFKNEQEYVDDYFSGDEA